MCSFYLTLFPMDISQGALVNEQYFWFSKIIWHVCLTTVHTVNLFLPPAHCSAGRGGGGGGVSVDPQRLKTWIWQPINTPLNNVDDVHASPYVFFTGEDDDCPWVLGFQQLLDGLVVILQLGVMGNPQRLSDADPPFERKQSKRRIRDLADMLTHLRSARHVLMHNPIVLLFLQSVTHSRFHSLCLSSVWRLNRPLVHQFIHSTSRFIRSIIDPIRSLLSSFTPTQDRSTAEMIKVWIYFFLPAQLWRIFSK